MKKFFAAFGAKKTEEIETIPKENTEKETWSSRLIHSLKKSSSQISEGIHQIFTHASLDEKQLSSLEDLLIMADLGIATSAMLVDKLRHKKFEKAISEREIRIFLAEEVTLLLEKVAHDFPYKEKNEAMEVILMIGVNGNGKTTSLGKMAHQFQEKGYDIAIAACDTFRAAAVSQLKIWAEKSDSECITGEEKSDPASVAYRAMEHAAEKDYLFVDTAGRLHNKVNLMEELGKLIRVIQKKNSKAPHHVLLVLDATTGQNAFQQLDAFMKIIPITGLIVTKLDGSAKGGMIVSLATRYSIPIYALGIGESKEDLKPFNARDFAGALVGL